MSTQRAVANVGVVGLAVMGSNLARNLASREGNTVAVTNRTDAKVDRLLVDHPEAGFVGSHGIADFVASLRRPRLAIVMVQAGTGTDAVISELAEHLEPGDVIVDGGNARYLDTIRRERELSERGIDFVGCGISGGEEGALNGPSLMPGGSAEAWRALRPVLESIAATAPGPDGEPQPCVTHVGTGGAGHFVKMVHNGIEYADMQLIAEAYDLLRRVAGLEVEAIADVFESWNDGELDSYLIEITAEVLRHRDERTDQPLVDVILDAAGAKGTGSWTVQSALELGVPVSGIGEAVFARSLSSQTDVRAVTQDLPGPEASEAPADVQGFVDDVRDALLAAKIIAYAQGFDLITAAAEEYGWQVDRGEVARIWRAGCIIRARFLDRITAAYAEHPDLVTLLTAPTFAGSLAASQQPWRRVVATAVAAGVPTPGLSAALAHYDGLRSPRLPAALIQAQRDFFGAHTYRRVDAEGVFHVEWSGDRSETEAGS